MNIPLSRISPHLFSEEVSESMGGRMVTSFEGGILLLEGPRLSVEEYRDSFGGIAMQKRSCMMPKSAKVLQKFGLQEYYSPYNNLHG